MKTLITNMRSVWPEENRWHDGRKKKRVPKSFEPFRSCIVFNKNFSLQKMEIVRNLKYKFNLSLTDAVNLMVFLHGVYGHNTDLINADRYHLGEEVFKKVI